MFRPDIIITRVSHVPGGTHGHHTASAILAHEAFDLAGDPNAFPEQLEQGLEVWQPRRLFHNGSTWWRKDLADIVKSDPDWFAVDVGGYDPLLGLSYTEIAGRSRSMHKSQGFGAAETRGEQLEYLHFEKGDRPKGDDIFEGIDMTWGRVKESQEILELSNEVISQYDPKSPSKSLDQLNTLNKLLLRNHGSTWNGYARSLVTELAQDMSGLFIEPLGDLPFYTLSDSSMVKVTLLSRNDVVVDLKGDLRYLANAPSEAVQFNSQSTDTLFGLFRDVNSPYWLSSSSWFRPGVLFGRVLPVWRGEQTLLVEGEIADIFLQTEKPIMYKWVDRVDGERIRPVYVTPVASIIPKTEILIARGGTQTIEVEVEALTDSLTGTLNVTVPEGWGSTKDLKRVNIAKRNERQSFTFQLMPGDNAKGGAVQFAFSGPKGTADRTLHEIDYPHIMPQVYYTPAEVKLIPLDVQVNTKRVGYIKGAGDDVPQAIERLGVAVDMLDPSTATLESLSKYDAIVVGIRAYNTEKAMAQFNSVLMHYVENGGTVVAQYNTLSRDMMVPADKIGPYPFELTRNRVTVEEAPPTFLDPKHPLLNTPNKITAADFDGWVQERGLYFVGERDPKYTALISWNDPGEDPLDGALITCDYGKGRYVYTGISFFRELPAGVAGAYRLWANLISRRAEK
jgi:hypothetical protein